MPNGHEQETIYPVLLNILKTKNKKEFASIYDYLPNKLDADPKHKDDAKKQEFILTYLNDENYGRLIKGYLAAVSNENYQEYIDFNSFCEESAAKDGNKYTTCEESAAEDGDPYQTPVKDNKGDTNAKQLISQLRTTPGSPLYRDPTEKGNYGSSPLSKIGKSLTELKNRGLEVDRLKYELGVAIDLVESTTFKYSSCQEILKTERARFTGTLNKLHQLLVKDNERPFTPGNNSANQENAEKLKSAIEDLQEELGLFKEFKDIGKELEELQDEELTELESKLASLTANLTAKKAELLNHKSALEAAKKSEGEKASEIKQLTRNLTATQAELKSKQEELQKFEADLEVAKKSEGEQASKIKKLTSDLATAFSSYVVALNYHKWFERTLILAVSLTAIAFFHLWEQKINVKDLFKNFSLKNPAHKIFFALMLGSMMFLTISTVFKYKSRSMSKEQAKMTQIFPTIVRSTSSHGLKV